MKGISAVVATLNRKDELERLFCSILDNDIKELELVIVDQNTNGLIDGLIASYRDRLDINHIKMTEANQSKARNLGASHAKYPVICFPDDDCWYDSRSLQHVQTYFEANEDTDLLVINWRQNPIVHNDSFPLTKKEVFTFRSVGYVTYVLFFNKGVFAKLGGFMETIGIGKFIGGGEDSELTFRAISNNLRVYYHAGIHVHHKYIPVTNRDLPVIRARQRAMGLMYAKYDIPRYVVLKGLTAPLVKAAFCMNIKKAREYYNMFLGRKEGYIYGLKNRANESGALIYS